MNHSTYSGDNTYCINCTGDAVSGDEVRFERAVFSGSFRNPKFDRFELVTGTIISDSYGKDRQQHTFTILLFDGTKIRMKGRNLYKNGIYRKHWIDERIRQVSLNEKHHRGDKARSIRVSRKFDISLNF